MIKKTYLTASITMKKKINTDFIKTKFLFIKHAIKRYRQAAPISEKELYTPDIERT